MLDIKAFRHFNKSFKRFLDVKTDTCKMSHLQPWNVVVRTLRELSRRKFSLLKFSVNVCSMHVFCRRVEIKSRRLWQLDIDYVYSLVTRSATYAVYGRLFGHFFYRNLEGNCTTHLWGDSLSVLRNLYVIRHVFRKCLRFHLHLFLSVINRTAIWSVFWKDKYLQLLCLPPNNHSADFWKSTKW